MAIFFFFWLGLKILTLVFQLQSSLIIYKTYCLEFLRICYPGLRRGIHASQSSTLWSYGPHSREFSEDKSSLSHLSNLLFSSSFNTLNGNGIEGVDLKKKKKSTMWGLCIKFYLGQNEDCSPRDSISDSSENLFQRGRREGQYICDFVKGEYIQSSTYFPRRFLLISGSFC